MLITGPPDDAGAQSAFNRTDLPLSVSTIPLMQPCATDENPLGIEKIQALWPS